MSRKKNKIVTDGDLLSGKPIIQDPYNYNVQINAPPTIESIKDTSKDTHQKTKNKPIMTKEETAQNKKVDIRDSYKLDETINPPPDIKNINPQYGPDNINLSDVGSSSSNVFNIDNDTLSKVIISSVLLGLIFFMN